MSQRGRSVYDIDPNDPQANQAATKIQAVYRGHQLRRSLKTGEEGGGMAADEGERDPTQQELEAEFDPSDKGRGGNPPTACGGGGARKRCSAQR